MMGLFQVDDGELTLALGPEEQAIVGMVPTLLDMDREDANRLSYVAHPDDPDAEAQYQELVADGLDQLRGRDRSSFERVIGGDPVSVEDVEGFMRVVGEARLVLAGRLGIEDDGWEEDLAQGEDPEMALLAWLGYVQNAAVEALSE